MCTADGIYDFSVITLFTFKDALEEGLWCEYGDAQGSATADAKILNAQRWITLSGATLYRHSRQETKIRGGSSSGNLWKGPEAFSMKRWHFWAGRFEAIGYIQWLPEHTRQLSSEAAERMRLCEREAEAPMNAEVKKPESRKGKRKQGLSSNQPQDGSLPPKRGPGRPRKEGPSNNHTQDGPSAPPLKRGRGRPRKQEASSAVVAAAATQKNHYSRSSSSDGSIW